MCSAIPPAPDFPLPPTREEAGIGDQKYGFERCAATGPVTPSHAIASRSECQSTGRLSLSRPGLTCFQKAYHGFKQRRVYHAADCFATPTHPVALSVS